MDIEWKKKKSFPNYNKTEMPKWFVRLCNSIALFHNDDQLFRIHSMKQQSTTTWLSFFISTSAFKTMDDALLSTSTSRGSDIVIDDESSISSPEGTVNAAFQIPEYSIDHQLR